MQTKIIGSRLSLLLGLALLSALACGQSAPTQTPGPDVGVTPRPETPLPPRPCGDGRCAGPENPENCPADCLLPTYFTLDATACELPNPQHAVVSEELLEFRDYLQDGGFEEGIPEVILSPHTQELLQPVDAERTQAAAHTGSWGYELRAGAGQGSTFSLKAYVEKGEDLRFSFWARSMQGEKEIQPMVYWVENEQDWGKPTLAEPVLLDQEWQQVQFVTSTKRGMKYALLTFEIGPMTTLQVDDVQVEIPVWRMAEYDGASRVVAAWSYRPSRSSRCISIF